VLSRKLRRTMPKEIKHLHQKIDLQKFEQISPLFAIIYFSNPVEGGFIIEEGDPSYRISEAFLRSR
jgi:hypothetical protein